MGEEEGVGGYREVGERVERGGKEGGMEGGRKGEGWREGWGGGVGKSREG